MDKDSTNYNEIFFELLCVAIGNRKSLTITPSAKQWAELFELSKKQALAAVAFAGVQKLCSSDNIEDDSSFGANVGMDEILYLTWLGIAAKTIQRNKELNAECANICRDLVHDGFKTIVLKGQSNLGYYPDELQNCRTPGDIDVWVRPFEGIDIAIGNDKRADYVTYYGWAAVVEYAKLQARLLGESEDVKIYYHHVNMPHSNAEVEAHFIPTFFFNPLLNKRLQEFLVMNGEPIESFFGLPIASISFNSVYQLCHLYKHLFDEGVGLRQLLDYFFVLRALHVEQGSFADRTNSLGQWAEGMSVQSNEEIRHILDRLGLKLFASAVMYVLKVVFAMPDEYMICKPDEKAGKHLLDEIMLAGNFGKYDPRNKDIAIESTLHKHIRKSMRNLKLAKYYPQEALWEPLFRFFCFFWLKLEMWRW